MRPRRWRGLALVGVTALLACTPEPRPSNVLVYLVDTLRADHLGLYGYGRDTSPQLDAFARDAVVYDAAYTPASWTRPATATLLTGRYPLAHGAITRANALDPGIPLLGEYLGRAGFATAAFVTNVNVLPVWGFGRGFDDFYDIDSETWRARSDQVNEVVLEYLDAHPAERFFYYVHTRDPHEPYEPPPPFDSLWPPGDENPERDLYDAEIRANDAAFGELLDALRERGLYDDTVIVFTSDHGEELHDRGKLGHGFSLFEEAVRIPLVVKYPGNAGAGMRVEPPVSLVDVVPTLLAALGAGPPQDPDGIDLRSAALAEPRALFFDLNLLLKGTRHVMDAVLLGRHKLVETVEPAPQSALFDLANDPGERADAAPHAAGLASHMEGVLGSFRSEARSGLHLAVVGPLREGGAVAEGRLRTTGRFASLRTTGLEAADEAVVSADGTLLRFRVALPPRRNPTGDRPTWLLDQDRMVVEVEPADAELVVEQFELAGQPAPVHLGPHLGRPLYAPVSFRRDAPELAVARMDTLLPVTKQVSIAARPGLYLGVVKRERREVAIDPETERRLQELGYVE